MVQKGTAAPDVTYGIIYIPNMWRVNGANGTGAYQPVVAIGSATDTLNYAFDNMTELKIVRIPASVTVIGFNAFKGCTSLVNVVFAGTSLLTTISTSAFDGCTKLETTGTATFSVLSGSVYAEPPAFASHNLFKVPETVTLISREAFKGCTEIPVIAIPKDAILGEAVFSGWGGGTVDPQIININRQNGNAFNANWRSGLTDGKVNVYFLW
jgi:hypothetical protein